MDSDTKEALDVVRVDLRDVESRLNSKISSLDSRISSVESRLRQEIREEGVTTRRHFDVVAESLRDDIRIIAEGLITLDAKVETMRRT